MEQHRLEFKAINGFPSSCNITIYREIQLVIISETGEGVSVTNASETTAIHFVKQFELDPKCMLFVEHHPESQRPQPYGESYDLVTFIWGKSGAYCPTWRHMPPAEFNEILDTINK